MPSSRVQRVVLRYHEWLGAVRTEDNPPEDVLKVPLVELPQPARSPYLKFRRVTPDNMSARLEMEQEVFTKK